MLTAGLGIFMWTRNFGELFKNFSLSIQTSLYKDNLKNDFSLKGLTSISATNKNQNKFHNSHKNFLPKTYFHWTLSLFQTPIKPSLKNSLNPNTCLMYPTTFTKLQKTHWQKFSELPEFKKKNLLFDRTVILLVYVMLIFSLMERP